MQYSSKEYEFLGKQVAAGQFISRTTCILLTVLALLVGMLLGRYVFPDTSAYFSAEGGEKRPLAQGSAMANAVSPNKMILQSIFQHEEELRRDPDNAETWEHLGNLYFDAGEPEKAVQSYNKALELKPGNVSVLVDCGVMYRQMKQYDKALEYFGKALAINPRHETALFNTGVVQYFDLGRKGEALEAWNELVKINPNAKTPTGEPVSKLIGDIS